MSKKFSKVPQGPDFGSFLVLGNDDWAAIELKTGYKLSQEVRELLALSTLFLTTRLAQEKSAPRLDSKNQKIIQKLKSLRREANNLRTELFAPHLWDKYQRPEYHLEVQLALELEDILDKLPISSFDILKFSLGAIIRSCENMLKKLNNMTGHGPVDGDAYDTWIVLVSLIMKSNGLDHGVSNSRRQRTSPFVLLIMEMQQRAIKKWPSLAARLQRRLTEHEHL